MHLAAHRAERTALSPARLLDEHAWPAERQLRLPGLSGHLEELATEVSGCQLCTCEKGATS